MSLGRQVVVYGGSGTVGIASGIVALELANVSGSAARRTTLRTPLGLKLRPISVCGKLYSTHTASFIAGGMFAVFRWAVTGGATDTTRAVPSIGEQWYPFTGEAFPVWGELENAEIACQVDCDQHLAASTLWSAQVSLICEIAS